MHAKPNIVEAELLYQWQRLTPEQQQLMFRLIEDVVQENWEQEKVEIPEEVMDKIQKDREDYLNGIGKTYTWEEVKEMIHNKEKREEFFKSIGRS